MAASSRRYGAEAWHGRPAREGAWPGWPWHIAASALKRRDQLPSALDEFGDDAVGKKQFVGYGDVFPVVEQYQANAEHVASSGASRTSRWIFPTTQRSAAWKISPFNTIEFLAHGVERGNGMASSALLDGQRRRQRGDLQS